MMQQVLHRMPCDESLVWIELQQNIAYKGDD